MKAAAQALGATRRWSLWGGIALIALAACVAYLPALRGQFILDDDIYLTNAPVIRASDGLYRIWCTSQALDYYPVTNTSLWLEWRLWGLNPLGYHVTNLLLHVAACLLIWAILRQLAIPGAFLAALLFAVHPLNVESVAWIAQRKGLLALVFFLLSILWYVREEQRRTGETRVRGGPAGFKRESTTGIALRPSCWPRSARARWSSCRWCC